MKESSIALALSAFSFLLTVIWGPPLIRILRSLKFGDTMRLELPERYMAKVGTPTMGGVLILLPVILITGLLNAVSFLGLTLDGLELLGRSILVPLGTMILFGALGATDDWEKLRGIRRVGEGLSIRVKFALQVVLAIVIAIGLRYVLDVPEMVVPLIGREFSLGVWYIPIATFLIVATANAVNFTDGMDGLAGLISATAFCAYGAIALFMGQLYLARFCFTVVGAVFGFLWFNVHPAQLIMGDTGSMSLGSALAVVALMSGQWLLLPVIAIIPVAEALSVVIQIVYFKLTHGKRFFKMSPFHMHFELLGLSETQIVQRFWLISLLAAMVGLALSFA
jgi:phospho-N-acetylmuramoyl-pentapeptide-transferase